MRRKAVDPSVQMRREIKVLQQRVTWLERALKPRPGVSIDKAEASRLRDKAKDESKRAALHEYYDAERVKRFRERPEFLQIELRSKRERNVFLKSRGFDLEPIELPKEAIPLARKAAFEEYQQLQKQDFLNSRAKFEAFMRECGLEP